MTQIEEIAKLVFRPGMTEQEFFQQIYAELAVRNYATKWNISLEQAKKRTRKVEKTGVEVCLYEQEWKKGVFYGTPPQDKKKLQVQKSPANLVSILRESYNYRRGIHFPNASDKEKEQMKKVINASSLMDISEQGNGPDHFIWRKPKNRWTRNFQDHDFGRFVVNADMNPKLIQDLDAFCQKYKCKYKTPEPENWHKRTDTVNVYLYEPMTDKMKKDFVATVKPFVRKSLPDHINSIDGEFLADGITCAQEFPEPERLALLESIPEHIKKRDWDSLMFEYKEFEKDANGEDTEKTYIAMSLGQRKVLEEFLDMYKKYAPKLKTNIRPSNIQTQAPQHKIQPVHPTPASHKPQQSPVDKLTPQHFIDKGGIKGVKYLDESGNVAVTETHYKNCTERVYANGLKMYLWKDSPSITLVDGTKKGRESTEMFIHTKGQGWTKMLQTTGELKRKIEEVRKAGLLVTNLPGAPQPRQSSTLKGRLLRHSVSHAQTAAHQAGKVQGS